MGLHSLGQLLGAVLAGALAGSISARVQLRRTVVGGDQTRTRSEASHGGRVWMGAGAGASHLGDAVTGAQVVNHGSGDAAGRDINK